MFGHPVIAFRGFDVCFLNDSSGIGLGPESDGKLSGIIRGGGKV